MSVRPISMKLLLVLLSLLAISLSCVAEDAAQLVYDTDNHKMTSEGSYYVLPAEHGTYGGLRKTHNPREPCKSFVIQALRSEADVGLPVLFKPLNDSASGMILLSTNITIQFDIITPCAEPMYWHVDLSSMHVAVGKDETATFPAPLPPEFVFRIERYNGGTMKGYKLVSCIGKGPCKNLGLHADKESTWLAISDSPLVVVFKKGHPYA